VERDWSPACHGRPVDGLPQWAKLLPRRWLNLIQHALHGRGELPIPFSRGLQPSSVRVSPDGDPSGHFDAKKLGDVPPNKSDGVEARNFLQDGEVRECVDEDAQREDVGVKACQRDVAVRIPLEGQRELNQPLTPLAVPD
jgi:hypothetical protein